MCNGEYSQTVRQMREKKDKYVNPYDEAFVEKIKPFFPHLKEAAFTGGEVFLIKIYYDIWNAMAEVNPDIRISITTNGTILNSRVKKYLEKLKFNITISLDSVHKDNFEQIRRFSNFDKYLENFEYFQQYTQTKNTFFTVKICPMRQNWHEIPDIIRFLNEKDVLFQFNNVVFPSYVALWNLSSTELNKIVQFLKGQKFEANTPTQNINLERVNNLILQLQNWEQKAKEFEKAYPDINQKNFTEISQMLLQSIHQYFNENPHIPIVNYHSITYKSMFQELIQKIDDEVVLKNAFLYYFRMPVSRFVSEFNIRDMEKIIERTIQVGQTVPPEIK
jgi:sulfatase maturation enzyme AslB (radical SAM superfamily)